MACFLSWLLFHAFEFFHPYGSVGAISASKPAENVEARAGSGEDCAIAIKDVAFDTV
jgi:hypothetical protein